MKDSAAALDLDAAAPRRGFRRRRGNRRVVVQRKPALVMVADGVGVLGRGLLVVLRVVGKVLLALGLLVVVVGGSYLGVRHVKDSPRFSIHEIEVSPTARITREELLDLAGVAEGDKLLALDTDAVAARIARHPWVAEARVRRQLPSAVSIEVVERRAAAVVALGALYLVDEAGRPFKRASMDEAEGLPVLTGVERAQYVDQRAASEGAFREALEVLAAWRAGARRPPLSEVNIHPRYGFTVFLLDGGTEVRLGRGDYERKLAVLDQIFDSTKAKDLRIVYLDGPTRDRITVLPREGAAIDPRTAPHPGQPAGAPRTER